jgi:DnaK suppressor protein
LKNAFLVQQRERIIANLTRYTNMQHPGNTSETEERKAWKTKIIPLLHQALEKIENGSYGICDSCEEPIPKKRLELIPGSLRCVACQKEWEVRNAFQFS